MDIKLKSNFAHRISNPLGIILGSVSLLKAKRYEALPLGDELVKHQLMAMQDAIMRIVEIIDEVKRIEFKEASKD